MRNLDRFFSKTFIIIHKHFPRISILSSIISYLFVHFYTRDVMKKHSYSCLLYNEYFYKNQSYNNYNNSKLKHTHSYNFIQSNHSLTFNYDIFMYHVH